MCFMMPTPSVRDCVGCRGRNARRWTSERRDVDVGQSSRVTTNGKGESENAVLSENPIALLGRHFRTPGCSDLWVRKNHPSSSSDESILVNEAAQDVGSSDRRRCSALTLSIGAGVVSAAGMV
jgi:hypothetical protein